MVRKLKAGTKPSARANKAQPYRSLSNGPSPKEQLQKLLERARETGVKPFTAQEFDRLMREPSSWPDVESIDDFLAWRRQTRKEAR